jgi:hypothetical protein
VNSGEHQRTVWDRVRPPSLPEWRKNLPKTPAGIDASGFGALGTPAGTAQLQPLQGLSRESTTANPLLRPAPSRAPAYTRVTTWGQGALHTSVLIGERRLRFAWGRPALRLRRVLAARRVAVAFIRYRLRWPAPRLPGRALPSARDGARGFLGDRALSGNSRLAGTRNTQRDARGWEQQGLKGVRARPAAANPSIAIENGRLALQLIQ